MKTPRPKNRKSSSSAVPLKRPVIVAPVLRLRGRARPKPPGESLANVLLDSVNDRRVGVARMSPTGVDVEPPRDVRAPFEHPATAPTPRRGRRTAR